MGREITALASYMQPLAIALLQNAKDAGIDCMVVDTDRTPKEQTQKIIDHVSWTEHSKHEPQPPEMKSEAIDICPLVLLGTKFWSPDSPLWQLLGPIGESLGLEWGGRWKHINNGKGDVSHFQYRHKPIVLTA